ncbi:MAG: cytochrome C [Pirellulales bacterium]|nr:cytochrome C [Pirellulales bacterium]
MTCIACHRVREMYGKTNGERRIEPGDILAPVYGSIGGEGVAIAASQKDNFKVKTSPHDKGPGQEMHAAGFCFPQLSKSEFCTSCHQVAVYPGIKLEVVWEQYRASPACKRGVSCQDCHMGRIPGVPSGYEVGAAAEINKKNVDANRKHANHTFYGPGYSIAHPGVFPFNPKAERWSMREWLLFDWRAGWGTDAFEDAVADGAIRVAFPPVWQEADDRYDAREIIDANLKKKGLKDQLRAQVMENGSHVEGPFFDKPRGRGRNLEFHYVVTNTNDGHNMPTASLGAQPQLWANVALIGPTGERLWESGYLDKLGDLADIHSEEVRHKRIAYDWQLFNLQTMFLITGAKGTDREFPLPVNIDIDPLPFIRPAAQPISVLNHPPFIRMEARSLAPLGSRRVPYKVPGHLMREPGRYRLSFRMRNRTEPMYFMRFCGSTTEMQRAMIEGTLDFHQSSVEFDVR